MQLYQTPMKSQRTKFPMNRRRGVPAGRGLRSTEPGLPLDHPCATHIATTPPPAQSTSPSARSKCGKEDDLGVPSILETPIPTRMMESWFPHTTSSNRESRIQTQPERCDLRKDLGHDMDISHLHDIYTDPEFETFRDRPHGQRHRDGRDIGDSSSYHTGPPPMREEYMFRPVPMKTEPFPAPKRGPRTPMRRGSVKIVLSGAGLSIVNGTYHPFAKSVWQKHVLPVPVLQTLEANKKDSPKIRERRKAFAEAVLLRAPQLGGSFEIPPLADVNASLHIAYYEELWRGQGGWAISYCNPSTEQDGNLLPTARTHLYYRLSGPPRAPNELPMHGWKPAAAPPPAPNLKKQEPAKNSENVMMKALSRLKTAAPKKTYTKQQLLAARCYYQDMPSIVSLDPHYDTDIIYHGAAKNFLVKLLDQERLARRQKQIDIGKATKEYQAYIKAVPKHRRPGDAPRTPPLLPKRNSRDVSKRRFTGILRAWRRHLHTYKLPTPEELDLLRPVNPNRTSRQRRGGGKNTDSSPKVRTARINRRRRQPEMFDDLGRFRPIFASENSPISPMRPRASQIPMVSPQKLKRGFNKPQVQNQMSISSEDRHSTIISP